MVGISFLICIHNEGNIYLQPLLYRVMANMIQQEDEIVILDDYSDDLETIALLEKTKVNRPDIKIVQHHLDNDFASHKNFGKSQCSKPFIFQIDGDELPHENLIKTLKETIIFNPEVELYRVPRINVVKGLTPEHIAKWGWQVNERGWINWPDKQDRVLRNLPHIGWINRVHEKITGHKTHADLPEVEDYCLLHPKSIERQEAQNAYYATL